MNPGQKNRDKWRARKCIGKFHFFPTSCLVSLFFSGSVISPTAFMVFLMSQLGYQNPEDCRVGNFHRSAHQICGEDGSWMWTLCHRAGQTNSYDAGPHLSTQNMATNKPWGRLKRPKRRNNRVSLHHQTLPAVPDEQLLSYFWKPPVWRHPCSPRWLPPLCLTLMFISLRVIQPVLTQFLLLSWCSCYILGSWLKDSMYLSFWS